jgi:radical SAM superfamily enzyme YgiQ (UPF0313 family)
VDWFRERLAAHPRCDETQGVGRSGSRQRPRLRRHGIEVGMFIMLGYDGERMEDLQATVDHLKHTRRMCS